MYHLRNYSQLSDYLDKLGIFHMDLTLGRVRDFWKQRGLPEIPVVHVVGTNGKGSTATVFETLARNHGLRTGLFTSPHFLSFRERVLVNGQPLSREQWVEYGNVVLSTPGGARLTYFEFQACLAMVAFADLGVDVAVMEAGMGGRFDATNVLTPSLTLFAPIGMDHELYLGESLAEIAMDKSGAIQPGGTVFTGPQSPEVMSILRLAVGRQGAQFTEVTEPIPDDVVLGLSGPHQRFNAALALAAWESFAALKSVPRDEHQTIRSLAQSFIPGRLQRVTLEGGQEYILDGAHNEHALNALIQALEAENIRPGGLVFTCMADKNIQLMVPQLRQLTTGPIAVPKVPNERAADPADIAALLGERAQAVESMSAALVRMDSAPSPVLVCGSLYLLGEFYKLHPRYLRRWNPLFMPSA